MLISRRQFLKYCSVAAGALGLTATDLMKLEKALALETGISVMWLMGATCTGCTTSFANSIYYATVQELLLSGPADKSLDLNFHPTLMAAAGDLAKGATQGLSPTVLVIEGAIQTGTPDGNGSAGDFCHVGELDTAMNSETMMKAVEVFASRAARILAVGTCASFGGIPAANGSLTDAKGLKDFYLTSPSLSASWQSTIRPKTISIPGCPPNPNWIVGTIAYLIANGYKVPALDSLRRPRMYYGERICNNCNRFDNSLIGQFIDNRKPDDIGNDDKREYCLKYIGCKGSRTKADCSLRKWNSPGYGETGVNWCVGAGAPCQGCTQDGFPDRMSPFHYIR